MTVFTLQDIIHILEQSVSLPKVKTTLFCVECQSESLDMSSELN